MKIKSILIPASALLLFTCGHGIAQPSATSSLNNLLAEGEEIDSQFLSQHEALSIAGTLPIPQVGSLYYYPDPENPATLIGFPVAGNSYWQIGTFIPPTPITDSDIDVLEHALMDVQVKRQVAVQLCVDELSDEAQLAISSNNTALQADLTNIKASLSNAEQGLYTAVSNYQSKLKPGIMIAEWALASQKGGQVSVTPIFQSQGSKSSAKSGFIILGNIRIVSLVIGKDYQSFYATSIKPVEFYRDMFPNVGLTTYMLQAKNVGYVNESDIDYQISAALSLDIKDFITTAALKALVTSLQIKIAAYKALDSQLVNTGEFGPVNWQIQNCDFTRTNALPDGPLPTNSQDWHTVLSIMTLAPKLYEEWNREKSPQADNPKGHCQ